MRIGLVLAVVLIASSAEAATVPASQVPQVAPPVDPALFPEGPEKSFVIETCDACHSLNMVIRHGGDVEDWTSRLVRMIRAGAPLTRDQVPALAAYLAKAFPERPRPQDTVRP